LKDESHDAPRSRPEGHSNAQLGSSAAHRVRRNAVETKSGEQQREALDSARAQDRKSQVGSGDRSERIRTYNFPQGRVSDHRINLTLYKLDRIISGDDLSEIIDSLMTEDQASRLAAEEAA